MRRARRWLADVARWTVLAALLAALWTDLGRADEHAIAAEVARVGFTVSDLDRSVAFFTDVLDFRPVGDVTELAGEDLERMTGVFASRARIARLQLGEETLELTQFLAPRGRPYPADSRGNDRWFQHVAIVVRDMDRAYARLREHGVEHASSGPQRLPDWNRNAGGIQAFYFRDPDGHFLEIIGFPPGKGDPRWQEPTEDLFLGIDHTAIVVADTERSLAFYRDGLGLRVVGGSENWGTEQEHLNGIFGARLRITTLHAEHGPGVELLEYLAPRDGRPAPSDLRPNDLAHWQTSVLLAPGGSWSPAGDAWTPAVGSPVELETRDLGYRGAFLVRDPDGHAVLLTRGDPGSRT